MHCSRDYSVSCTSVLMSSLPTSITFNVLNSHSSHFSIFSWKHLFHKCQAIISSQHVLICLITTSSGRQLHLTVCHLHCTNRVSTYGSVHHFQKSFTTDWTRWYQEEVFVSYDCHPMPRGLDAVARPSNKLLGVKTLMIESSLGFTPGIGGSFIKLDTSLQNSEKLMHRQSLVTHWKMNGALCLLS